MFCHLLGTKSLHSQCWLIVNCTLMIKPVKFQAKYERRKSIRKWRPLNGRYIVSASNCPSIILHNRKRFTLNVRPYLIQIYCENSIVERNINIFTVFDGMTKMLLSYEAFYSVPVINNPSATCVLRLWSHHQHRSISNWRNYRDALFLPNYGSL